MRFYPYVHMLVVRSIPNFYRHAGWSPPSEDVKKGRISTKAAPISSFFAESLKMSANPVRLWNGAKKRPPINATWPHATSSK